MLAKRRAPEGEFKVRSGTAVIDTTILSDQALKLRIRQGQVHALRRRKVLDPEDQFPNWELGARWPMTSHVTSSRGAGVTPSRARNVTPPRERMAELPARSANP